MKLNGFERRCTARTGGVESLFLIAARDIEAVDYDTLTHNFRGMTLREGAQFARYDFAEDSCSLSETFVSEDGAEKVLHEIRFSLARSCQATGKALRELAGAGGLVAIVVTGEGDALLVGYSHTFASERALRMVSALGSSGQRPEDEAASAVVLTAQDTSFSCTVSFSPLAFLANGEK